MTDAESRCIPVVDLFAGPGGLGEGFSAVKNADGSSAFRVGLSIEKEAFAHQTLELRSFFRQFSIDQLPEDYYRLLRGEIDRETLYGRYPAESDRARAEAWHCTLGSKRTPRSEVNDRITAALGTANNWLLIGGPPCQAYSVIGRSRTKGKKSYGYRRLKLQGLYLEYLQVIADHWPAAFVMENVRGLLSATRRHGSVFDRVMDDLRSPSEAIRRENRTAQSGKRSHRYEVFSLSADGLFSSSNPASYVVHAERHGIPQSRHRVILLGVRDDIRLLREPRLGERTRETIRSVIGRLPRLRSGLSRIPDSDANWREALKAGVKMPWVDEVRKKDTKGVLSRALTIMKNPGWLGLSRGAEFVECDAQVDHAEKNWFIDARIGGVCSHSTRGHMASDLYRYLFASCFAEKHERSPELGDFPQSLLPDHGNVAGSLDETPFLDRFRVQPYDRPATTVVSHISKDGHYYIHPDPEQCRSLTVREAARIQTFPDNYLFLGPRTAQYVQVGNAVPPLLARQIAGEVLAVLQQTGIAI
jgi:DNA (cytosine-5)-methyltransferase 1